MTQRPDTTLPPPWYRQFWPWLLIALPGSVVIACIITVTIAFRYQDALVADDWYKQGRAINYHHERDALALELGLVAHLAATADGGLALHFEPQAELLPARVALHLHHPMRATDDRQRILLLDDGRADTGPLALPAASHWYVSIESLPDAQPAWRIRGLWSPERNGGQADLYGQP